MVTLFNCFSFNDEWYLVEMALNIPPEDIDFMNMVVPEDELDESSWQVPFSEQYLNSDGTERICDLYKKPDKGASSSRVAFFIYKTDSNILRTPYGEFELSDEYETPDRLRAIIEFEYDDEDEEED